MQTLQNLQSLIETSFAQHEALNKQDHNLSAKTNLHLAISEIISKLEGGELRVAEQTPQGWRVNSWVKQAILLYFALNQNKLITGEISNYYDKVPLQFTATAQQEFQAKQVRVVPPACVRRGAYIGAKTVLMPSFVNIGAYIGTGCMIDTWATIGSCAQIGNNVHISGGAGIGGVLEPLQANPTIIEDNCFIGARSEIVEGVIVEAGAVISMGVFIGQSTKIYDRSKDEIIYGRVPAGSVVVPGSLPADNGKYQTYCAIIIKRVDAKTRAKVAINQLLRD